MVLSFVLITKGFLMKKITQKILKQLVMIKWLQKTIHQINSAKLLQIKCIYQSNALHNNASFLLKEPITAHSNDGGTRGTVADKRLHSGPTRPQPRVWPYTPRPASCASTHDGSPRTMCALACRDEHCPGITVENLFNVANVKAIILNGALHAGKLQAACWTCSCSRVTGMF